MMGYSIGSGGLFDLAKKIRLTIFSFVSLHGAGSDYTGSLYVFGAQNGKIVYISTPLHGASFSTQNGVNTCVSSGDCIFEGKDAKVVVTWTQSDKAATLSIAVVEVATGIMLYGTNDNGTPVVLTGGQVVVHITSATPPVAVVPVV